MNNETHPPDFNDGSPRSERCDDDAITCVEGMEMTDMAALAGGWGQARALLAELSAAPELVVGLAEAVFGLAITLDAYIRRAVPSSVLLSYRAGKVMAEARSDPSGALSELATIVDTGRRAAEAVHDGQHQRAAEILLKKASAGETDVH